MFEDRPPVAAPALQVQFLHPNQPEKPIQLRQRRRPAIGLLPGSLEIGVDNFHHLKLRFRSGDLTQ